MNNLSHGIDYSKFAYRVAFLRQFYTISSEQGENAKQQRHGRIGESDELDTSTNRKWKSVVTILGKKKELQVDQSIHLKDEIEDKYWVVLSTMAMCGIHLLQK